MSETVPKSPSRGRPPSITRERLTDAGIALTLPKLTMVGVADQLGVSAMALYKHVSGLEALKELVAEEIFCAGRCRVRKRATARVSATIWSV